MYKFFQFISFLSLILFTGCASVTTYEIPEGYFSKDEMIISEKKSATAVTKKLGIFKLSHEDALTKLLDENPGYDFVIHPVYKKRVVPTIPMLLTTEMIRIEARLGKYKKN